MVQPQLARATTISNGVRAVLLIIFLSSGNLGAGHGGISAPGRSRLLDSRHPAPDLRRARDDCCSLAHFLGNRGNREKPWRPTCAGETMLSE